MLDEAHLGDIQGAMGSIRLDDQDGYTTLAERLKTLSAIVGPGLIVMVGEKPTGAFDTCTYTTGASRWPLMTLFRHSWNRLG